MIPIDQEVRDEILAYEDNMYITASAGSGKTTIMVKKIEVDLKNIKNHQTVAAITFTNKATDSIRKQVQNKSLKPFTIINNDSFAEKEVIRPFIKDALGENFSSEFKISYESVYRVSDFSKALVQLKEEKVLGTCPSRIGNFKFKLALTILKKSLAAQEYLKYKYYRIFIDEYQDCDREMHEFFIYLAQILNIKLFLVGDEKQAIYTWRGALPDIFDRIQERNFKHFEIFHNFRCHPEINNFANIAQESFQLTGLDSVAEKVHLVNYNKFNNFVRRRDEGDFSGFIEIFNSLVKGSVINTKSEIAIIVNVNKHGKDITEILNGEGYNFTFIPRTPLDENSPNTHILKALASTTVNSNQSAFDLIVELNIEVSKSVKKVLDQIIKSIRQRDEVGKRLDELGELLNIIFTEQELNNFLATIDNQEFHEAFINKNSEHQVLTVFAAKGLEYEQVLSFSRYYKIDSGKNKENHYVCVTRAKEKFVMLVDRVYYKDFIDIKASHHTDDLRDVYNYIY